MLELLKGTTAYKIVEGDRQQNRVSHAYMLYLPDEGILRRVCARFAALIFGGDASIERRILAESHPDAHFYPQIGKKLSAADAAEIVDDCAIRPVEGDKKVYIIVGFDTASAVVQNKLLKSLEEPPQGVYFLLGVTSLAPILPTVKSRVKNLSIPPFSQQQVLAYLNRRENNAKNAQAAASCAGLIGVAEGILEGAWYAEVDAAAREFCAVNEKNIGEISAKYAEFKYKNQLISRIQELFFSALKGDESEIAKLWNEPALSFACEYANRAAADLKFNAQFSALLYDFALRLVKENDKWKKLLQ